MCSAVVGAAEIWGSEILIRYGLDTRNVRIPGSFLLMSKRLFDELDLQ